MEEMTSAQQGAETTVQQEAEKTFTQEEVNRVVEKRLERERKKYPSSEELEQFRQWQQSQQTQAEKWENLQKERNSFEMKREKYLLAQGIAAEDVDYYAFKIAKAMQENDDFETVAQNYLKEKKNYSIVNFGLNTTNQGKTLSLADQINQKLRGV